MSAQGRDRADQAWLTLVVLIAAGAVGIVAAATVRALVILGWKAVWVPPILLLVVGAVLVAWLIAGHVADAFDR